MVNYIVGIVLVYLVFNFVRNRTQEGYQRIAPEQAREKIKKTKDTILLDVRTPQEYSQGHIPKSKLLTLNTIKSRIESIVPDKDKDIIVYCKTGSRSRVAANTLLKLGYKNVHDLGGIISWPYEIK